MLLPVIILGGTLFGFMTPAEAAAAAVIAALIIGFAYGNMTMADVLASIQRTTIMLGALFILLCALINLSLGSASAQWAVTAPIFVPMLMLIGYSPEAIQAAYRIGDSTTNIITPMMSYFGLILAWATRYQKDLGVGTLIAMMLPYSMFFIVAWSAFFYLWTFILGLPVGPGSPTYYIQ